MSLLPLLRQMEPASSVPLRDGSVSGPRARTRTPRAVVSDMWNWSPLLPVLSTHGPGDTCHVARPSLLYYSFH